MRLERLPARPEPVLYYSRGDYRIYEVLTPQLADYLVTRYWARLTATDPLQRTRRPRKRKGL